MIAKRLLASAACVPLLAAAAVGQSFTAPPPTPQLASPAGSSQPFGPSWPAPTALLPGKSVGVRPASAIDVPALPTAPSPTDTLVGSGVPSLPTLPTVADAVPGAVYSPWCGDTPAGGCYGPVGANGPVTYEPYLRTGVSLISGGGTMAAVTKTFGWNFQGGARSLFFNPTGDAAWVFDLGLSHTNHRGRGAANPLNIEVGAVKFGGGLNRDLFAVGLTELRRTSFNFGLGRDYFLNGPGVVGQEPGYGNFRAGWDIGGRWGTASADFEPFGDPGGNRRRQDVFHGLYLGGQGTWERPMGAWTFYIGGRIEWGYYWTDMIPPNDGDFRDVNLLLVGGVRF
ncbi:MAG: hypothetical protein MUF18_08250 [Fimbriiglobus sp.]|nr:hypothetical protein [Fimbriiglobus sp.]